MEIGLGYIIRTVQFRWTIALCIFVSMATAHRITYHEGRLYGAPPSADYLRKNPGLVADSATALPLRALWGSSNYTNSTYVEAVRNGTIYWAGGEFEWKTPAGAEMPNICTNVHRKRPTGETLGYFICPSPDLEDTDLYCCGNAQNETCCDFETARIFYYSPPPYHYDFLDNAGVIFTVLVIVFFPFAVVFFCTECFKASKNSYSFLEQK